MFQTTFNEQRSRKKQPSKMASFFSRRTIRALSEPRKKEDKPSLQTTLQCLLLLEKRKHYNICNTKIIQNKTVKKRHKSLSSALLISRYILGLVQRGRWFFCAACPNRKMYLEIRSANVGAYSRCFIAT